VVLTPGRKGTTTPRDQRIFEALFFCRYLSTKQIAELFFGSESRARARLSELEAKRYISRRSMYVRLPTSMKDRVAVETVWYLTKEGFDTVATTHGRDEKYAPKQLLDEKARHYVRAAEVYVAAKDRLESHLGPHPAWEWRHEKRVEYAGEYENVPYYHRPDAHVLIKDHTYIIERQTPESKVGPKKVYKKVADHKLYVYLKLESPAEVLFACEDQAVAQAAERAGGEYDLRVVGKDVEGIADYLYNSAVRLS
jgi:hypothetical protein